MVDTLALARDERKRQGSWETEITFGGEADLHQHYVACPKNPGHSKFLPIDQFNMDHLPDCYHDNDIVECIRLMSALTVRVSVKYVSERRPATIPGTDKPYLGYSSRGKNMMRVGTGLVSFVMIFPTEYMKTKGVCRCNECSNSPTPKTKHALLTIHTAAHVVFDDLEGAQTTCHLFFDEGSSPDVNNDVFTLSGMSHVRSDIDRDFSQMTYITHDLELIDRLDKLVERLLNLQAQIIGKYPSRQMYEEKGIEVPPHVGVNEPLIVIVSHPHGCSKQVSVGHCSDRLEPGDQFKQFIYTTPTCPGSSGACVFVIGKGEWGWGLELIHSGHYNEDHNCSGLGWDFMAERFHQESSDS